MKKNCIYLFTGATLLLGALLMMPTVSTAQTLSVTRTVYLEHGAVVDPKVIVRTHDNGLIVVGSLERPHEPRSAWATKTDIAGNVVWRYTAPLREKINRNDGPEFTSAAVMSDDSVFLCGRMPTVQDGAGLLTHLDKNGNVLSEQLLKPRDLDSGSFVSCVEWNGGIAIVGTTGKMTPAELSQSHPSPYDVQFFYWIASFDINGKMKWEKLVPLSDKREGFDYISPLQLTPDGGFVFVTTRYTLGTRVLHVNADGDLLSSRVMDENSILLQPHSSDADIRLLSTQTESLTLITLDGDLQELKRLTAGHEVGEVDMAHLLPDGSIVLFGAKHDKKGWSYLAWAMCVDPKLEHSSFVPLGATGESGWAKAGVPLRKAGEFVSIRRAITPSNLGIRATEEQLSQVRLGVALDFIQLK